MTMFGKKIISSWDVTPSLMEISCQSIRLQRVGFHFIILRILEFKDPYFVCFFVPFIFEKIEPIIEDIEDRIEGFLVLPEIKKLFKLEHPIHQESSISTILVSTSKDPQLICLILNLLRIHTVRCPIYTCWYRLRYVHRQTGGQEGKDPILSPS